LKLSCQGEVDLELRCGFFGADLELLQQAAGKPWVCVAEAGRRVEVKALTETKADVRDGSDAALRIHLREVPGAASFLVLAAITSSTDPLPLPLQYPLVMEIASEGVVIHRVSRQEASGGSGTLLAVLSRGAAFGDPWLVHNISPNSSAVVCGEGENAIVRELYWPEVGVAIQRSSPAATSAGSRAVTWLEVFQVLPEGSEASSDDEDIGYSGESSSGDASEVLAAIRAAREASGESVKSPCAIEGLSTSDSEVACGYDDARRDSDALCGYGDDMQTQIKTAASTADSIGKLPGLRCSPSGPHATETPSGKSAMPRFGNSPSPLSQSGTAESNTNTSPSLLGEHSAESVAMMLGSPLFNIAGPPSLVTSPLGITLGSDGCSQEFSPVPPLARAMVVEQPTATIPANVRHHKAAVDIHGARFHELQEENIALRTKCELHEKEFDIAAKREVHLEEAAGWAREHLSHERALLQQTRELHTEELKVMNTQRSSLETELAQASVQLQERAGNDSKLEEVARRRLEHVRNEHAEELRDCQKRDAEHRENTRNEMAQLTHEVEDLRYSADLQKNQLSQSQSLAAELRAEARNLCEERDANLAEAYAERVRAIQLQANLTKEHNKLAEMQSKLLEAQTCSGDSCGSGAYPGMTPSVDDRRERSLLTLQQRLQEATLEVDSERRYTAEYRSMTDHLQEVNVSLQQRLEEAECQKGAYWQRELNALRAEFKETEHEFHEELASVRGRLGAADQRNRKLCESLRAAMQSAGHQSPSVREVQETPATPNLPAPRFVFNESQPKSPCQASGLAAGGENCRGEVQSHVPRASAKPPRNLQGDYSRFLDWNSRSATDLGACQARSNSSATSSPKGELRATRSFTSLPSRSMMADLSTVAVNDVSEGAPELGFGPGGPGAARFALAGQHPAPAALPRELFARGAHNSFQHGWR
jgi:hypothetical protein